MKQLLWISIFLGILLTGCPPIWTVDHCVPLDTRCNGQKAELCATNGNWTLTMDCAQSPGFLCAFVASAAGHTCIKGVE